MNQITIAPDISRADYARAVEVLAKSFGISPEEFEQKYKIMPFICKMAQYLNTGLSSYTFSPRKGVDSPIPNTQLLDQNDFFIASKIGLRFGRAAFASNTYSNHGNYPLLTYPDPAYFSGSGTTAGSEWQSLQTIVNGSVSLAVNSDTQIENVLAQDCCFNPMSTYLSSPVTLPQFGGDNDGEKGYYSFTPNFILDASADNAITVNLANGAKGNIDGAISTLTTDSGIRNILYVLLSGWKIKNMAGVALAGACARA